MFCLYPTFVAGILSRVEEINFYILSNNKLKYLDYIEKCIYGKQCTVFSQKYDEYHFKLSSGEESVDLTFEIRIMDGKLPSELTFVYSVINKIRLSCLTYGIECVNNRVAYITNEVLNSKHECVLEKYCCDFDMPKRLAGCKLYTKSCLLYPYKIFPFYMLFCTKNLIVKFGMLDVIVNYVSKRPASLKSMCVNKLGYLLDNGTK